MNLQKIKYRALDDWFLTPQGVHVADSFAACLAVQRDVLQGTTLLQLGDGGKNIWLDLLDFRRKWIVSPCLDAPQQVVISALNALPFERNSLDCVLALFALEAFGWDKNPVDEMDRILKPMGHAVFFGINPFSLWGLAGRLGFASCLGMRDIALISPFFLQQSLLRRGYRQCYFESFYYIPPVREAESINRLAFLNEMGKMISLNPAGFYCLIMQKYQKCRPKVLRRTNARRNTSLTIEPAWASRDISTYSSQLSVPPA